MKKIGIIAVCVFSLTAGSVFAQGTLESSILELETKLDSLKALKYGLSPDKDGNSVYGGWLQMPEGVLQQNLIPDTLLKFYQYNWNQYNSNFNRQPESNYWPRGDGKPGYPVPESPIPRSYERGVPYYDGMPSQPNDKRSAPVPGFPGWKVQEIMMKSERS
jgi:hypothetical protein